jgi:hypothetical protein
MESGVYTFFPMVREQTVTKLSDFAPKKWNSDGALRETSGVGGTYAAVCEPSMVPYAFLKSVANPRRNFFCCFVFYLHGSLVAVVSVATLVTVVSLCYPGGAAVREPSHTCHVGDMHAVTTRRDPRTSKLVCVHYTVMMTKIMNRR